MTNVVLGLTIVQVHSSVKIHLEAFHALVLMAIGLKVQPVLVSVGCSLHLKILCYYNITVI